MTIQAILFDIDGTLIDSNDLHVLAWEEAFSAAGKIVERRTLHDQIGKGTDMLVPALWPELDKAAQDSLGEAHGAIFKARYLDQAKPFAGARDLLAYAHQRGQRLALASSASKEELDHYIDLLHVRDLIDISVTSQDVDRTKPAPDIFAVALDRLDGLDPSQVIVVGDTPYDVEAAGKCGIAAVALRSGGFSPEVLQRAGAKALYDNVAALLADYEKSPLSA